MSRKHVRGFGIGGYDRHRDTQWTRNSEAILHFLEGGCVELFWSGKWQPITPPDRMDFFHKAPVRPCGFSLSPSAVPVEALTERPSR